MSEQAHEPVGPEQDSGPTGPVIRDKRRLDPKTGQVREQARQQAPAAGDQPMDGSPVEILGGQQPSGPGAGQEAGQRGAGQRGAGQDAGEAGAGQEVGEAGAAEPEHPDTVLAAERLEDLRRLQAEYLNYKRRVERDRAHDRDLAVASVVEALLPVLDDVHSAREHGDLTEGPFLAIADKLEATLGRLGAEKLGAVGEEFDPNVHEALMRLSEEHLPEGATGTTIVKVMQPGFRVGERLVRAARVAVAEPEAG